MTPVVRLVLEPAVIVVKNDAPYKTLKDFIDAAKKTPGQLKQSGGSITSRDNVVRQLLDEAHRRELGVHLVSRAAASASRRCSADTCT